MRKIFLMAAGLLAANITAAQAQSSDAILNRIKQKKQISIGYREASIPFSFLNDERKPVGYALDICIKVVDAVKQKLELPDLAVNYVAVNPQNRIALVANGTVESNAVRPSIPSPGSHRPISAPRISSPPRAFW
jgi:glutamate/aspartate transport system substrate-binding protein